MSQQQEIAFNSKQHFYSEPFEVSEASEVAHDLNGSSLISFMSVFDALIDLRDGAEDAGAATHFRIVVTIESNETQF